MTNCPLPIASLNGRPSKAGGYALSVRDRGQAVVFIGASAVFPSIRGIRKKKRGLRGRKRRKRKGKRQKMKKFSLHRA